MSMDSCKLSAGVGTVTNEDLQLGQWPHSTPPVRTLRAYGIERDIFGGAEPERIIADGL